MAKVTGTIPNIEVRNLDAEQLEARKDQLHRELNTKHGFGLFLWAVQADGSITWEHEHAAGFADGHPQHGAALADGGIRLSANEVEAIKHGKVALLNLGDVHLRDGAWVSNIDAAEDPAIPARLNSINTLEGLIARVDETGFSELTSTEDA